MVPMCWEQTLSVWLTSPALTVAVAASFAQLHGAAEFAADIAELQHRLAIEKLLVFTRIFQGVAVDARRRVASFALTPRAMPDAARTSKEEVQIPFGLTSPYKSLPRFSGRWIAQVSSDATVNDVARMVHRQLWGFTDEDDEEGGSLAVLPDSVLQETSVLLCGSDDSEQALFDPRQRTQPVEVFLGKLSHWDPARDLAQPRPA